jgi:hypothetical protein
LSKDPTQKLFEYIALLENANEQLVKTLKKCVELLTEFKPSVPDPERWQEMLDVFQKTIKAGERIVGHPSITIPTINPVITPINLSNIISQTFSNNQLHCDHHGGKVKRAKLSAWGPYAHMTKITIHNYYTTLVLSFPLLISSSTP